MMLAEIALTEWIMVAATVGLFVIALIALNKKQEVKVQQPVAITITEELHKIFAAKEVLEKHIAENREDHDKIFSKIGGVERGAANSLEAKVETVRKDVVVVSNQVAGLKVQTDIQNQQLSRIEKTVGEMPGKIVADVVNAKKL